MQGSGVNCKGWDILHMTIRDFRRFSGFIEKNCGIRMPETKKSMLESRLQRRVRALGMRSFGEYGEFVFGPEGANGEIVRMIDQVTTNKTDFFREPFHFEYLYTRTLTEIARHNKKIRLWSAGCSSGEEPYTLAMVLSEFAEKNGGFSYSILATDICLKALAKARQGIYEMERAEPIPLELKTKYMLKSKDRTKGLVRVAPELRAQVEFRNLNLINGDYGVEHPLDIIFCRNVLIYFEKSVQEKVINRFHRSLALGGYLFIGHSESINGLDVPLKLVAPTIYRKVREN